MMFGLFKKKNNAFAVSADVKSYGYKEDNKINAVFKNREDAHRYGRMMWGRFYIIEPIYSKHFEY